MTIMIGLLSQKGFAVSASVLLIFSCIHHSDIKEGNIFSENPAAQWIQDRRELPQFDSLFYLDQPAPLFRKEFKLQDEILKAKLFITAAGYYQATINGTPVGDHLLDPAWTDYTKRIYYSEYDVTKVLTAGGNCLGVTLGNGFYNPLPMRKWGRRNPRRDLKLGNQPSSRNCR